MPLLALAIASATHLTSTTSYPFHARNAIFLVQNVKMMIQTVRNALKTLDSSTESASAKTDLHSIQLMAFASSATLTA